MSPVQLVPEILRRLPSRVRSAVYTTLALIGAALAVCTALGVKDLGPLTVARALQIYAFVSPLVGGVAVANVGQSANAGVPGDSVMFDEEPADLSSFEPVADASEVFGLTPA